MKYLMIVFLSAPFLSIAQKPYVKISPTLFILADKDMGLYTSPAVKDQTFGGFVSGGFIIHKYISAGLTAGYLKPIDMKVSGIEFNKPVIPVGLDFTFTDFENKKVKPVLQVQAMYPIHKQPDVSYTDDSGNDFGTGRFKGTILLGAAGGIAIPVFDDKKLMLTAGYSSISLKNNYPKKSTSTGMVTISVSFFYN